MIFKVMLVSFFICIDATSCCINQVGCMTEDQKHRTWMKMGLEDCYKYRRDDGKRIVFLMYTPDAVVELNESSIVDNKKPIKVIVPGLGANGNTTVIKMIIDAYLYMYGSDYIVIVPDHVFYIPVRDYIFSYCNVPIVAMGISIFLNNLVEVSKVDPKKIHLIGSSLGAHIAGVTGSYFQKFHNRTIGRITGIDPTALGFICPSYPECLLDKTDAAFVDIITTNKGVLGTTVRSGHVHFLVNGGALQPGCKGLDRRVCDHKRGNYIFNESIILNSFLAKSCTIFNKETEPECRNIDIVYMGEYCREKPKYNLYIVYTSGHSPYGFGPNGPILEINKNTMSKLPKRRDNVG